MLSEEPGSGLYGSLHVVHKHTCRAQGASGGMTEKEGWEKRKEEAGEEVLGSTDSWQWSLNWNEITPTIVVGACPRSADDVIPFESIRKRAMENGVFLARVPIRDFDHADQALMLPEAVRMLNVLVSRGRRVYVHCTAGINRATLSVVGYLTFVQGFTLDDAVQLVKKKRKVAHPYIDCWQEVKKKLLDGRQEELTGLSRKIYEGRCEGGQEGSSQSDWQAAQGINACVPNSESLRSLFLGECHDATGHFGYKKTAANSLQRFWWPTMMGDAQLYVATCQVCQRDKPRTQAPLGLLKPLPIPERPGESLSMDFMDTLITSKSGMRQIFVIVDRFSKYARLIAMPETTKTEYVIKLFKENWIRDFGLPKSIVSDRDVRFTSELWKAAAAEQGTQLQMTSGSHPEANGQAEQMNRTVQHLLRHYIKPNQVDWDEKLALVASLYNNAVHSATGRAAICRIFARWLEVDLGALDVERELTERRMQSAVDRANALADSAKRLARDAEKRKALEVTNGAAFSYAAYVADAEKLIEDEVYEPEEPYYPMSEECDVVTRECTAEAEEPGQFDDEWGLDPQQRSEVGQRITVAAASSSLTSSKVVASSVSVSVSVSATESSPTSLHSSPSSSSSSSSLSSSASSSSASSAAVSSSVASHQVAGAASPGASPTPPSTQQPEPSLGVPQAETQSESVREESRAELKPGSALASSSHQLPAAASADASTTPPSTQQPHSSLGVPQAETQSESVKEQSLPEQKPGNALPSSLLHQVPEAASPDTSPDPSSTQQPQESLGVPRAESQSESVREQSLPE
ncbi:hypothetical protein CBR_g50032 [Chara braunii]|uniref:Integrase catalytic domain-containing protein n=1 Tax=Chara braunii TaxID=69332 RepID=A0A388M644_CHABU|nr:hypothetical protein CBR_g50032 [Chara braunii]|eukprot:GBG89942.1 hypothetical protein CBR_g50032 [Chara braunii]